MALKPNQPHPIVQRFPRTAGLVILLIGFAFFYVSIIEPIFHANVGNLIKLSGKGGLVGGLFIILGLLLIFFGSGALALGQTKTANSRKFMLILGGIFGIVGIVAMEFTKLYLRSKGYILP